jgi:hypothetical protein
MEFKAGGETDSRWKFAKVTLVGIMKDELRVTSKKQLTNMFA